MDSTRETRPRVRAAAGARAGYTLMEVLAASFILVVAFGTAMSVFVVSMRTAAIARRRVQAVNDARALLEELTSCSWFDNRLEYGKHKIDNNGGYWTVTPNPHVKEAKDVHVVIEWRDEVLGGKKQSLSMWMCVARAMHTHLITDPPFPGELPKPPPTSTPPKPVSSTTSTSVTPRCATPWINPRTGYYGGDVTVTMGCGTSGAVLHYTTDGSYPTEASPVYGGAFVVTPYCVVRARAYKPGYNCSYVTTRVYKRFGWDRVNT
ncbi:MAG: chitobiase/beta-hexosaminidase C-terminal domain-containing protein [Kiritimatiellae bacterium]|nr:chitobiase/beta-hexosaminidase C-terminal domain-containing protein [Kiritimatiellia bacterium]